MSATLALSNTICVSMAGEQPDVLASHLAAEYTAYGDIARLDMSMSASLRCFLVTFFDVRSAQLAAVASGGAAMPFPGAEHDFRCVQLSLASPAAAVGVVGGFGQFGEVAHVSATQEHLAVEFFDLRAAQRLLAASGGAAAGAVPLPSCSPAPCPQEPEDAGTPIPAPPGMATPLPAPPGMPAKATPEASPEGSPRTPATTAGSASPASDAAAAGKLLRSKVTNKDFSKFDIHPEMILSGEDTRTTVMVRNLLGNRARKDFLHFLEVCGLAERYTFFYMPCKEHRDMRAGFAFVNFKAPADVQRLFVAVGGNKWQQLRTGDGPRKPLAMSYARFQGHDELMSHFSSSVVIHERDPEKRPIFKAGGGEAAKSKDKKTPTPPRSVPSPAAPKAAKSKEVPTPPRSGIPSPPPAQQRAADAAAPVGAKAADVDTDFHQALQQGILQLSSLIALEAGRAPTAPADNAWATKALPPGLGFSSAHVDPTSLGA